SSIFTQSSQSILVSKHVAFFAAQDSIIKYNLNTLKRMAAIADSGLSHLALYNGKLLVSKQYPVSRNFFEVLDTADLGLIAQVPGISGDCAGIACVHDTVYVAVNGGWLGTEGKLAVIDPSSWTLKTEVNFGHQAIGIWDLFIYKGKICSVNKTPYGVIDTGSVTLYLPSNRRYTSIFLPFNVSAASGVHDSLLYLGLNYGIASFNLNTRAIADTVIVPDPGSAMFTYILSSALDTLNGRIYTNIGDYVSPGYCLVTNLKGDSITSYPTGISSDAIAVDTRYYGVGINDNADRNINVILSPNPAREKLRISLPDQVRISSLVVTDLSGREILRLSPSISYHNDFEIPVNSFSPGMYYLVLGTAEGTVVKPFAISSH
ncbi:MAG: T9SS type A sorting domain-containing protein, partial [Bacteroidetes bacterium]|nr:T9SS type A sorting domain-containing protein [Bacteroidota bacterium]